MCKQTFLAWVLSITAALVLLVSVGCGDGDGGQDGDSDSTDLIDDEGGDADADAMDVNGEEAVVVDVDATDVTDVNGEEAADTGGDVEPECPEMPWECPDYLIEGGYFCDGDDLYSGGIACDVDCGCSCISEFVEHCDAGCHDPEDGNAQCN